MTPQALRHKLHDLVKSYFFAADVVWAMQGQVNPDNPTVLLKMLPVVRQPRPTRQDVDGIVVDSYPSKTTLQIDLFTQGAEPEEVEGVKQRWENTAVSDLADFVNFLGSVLVDHWCYANDVSIEASTIHDLTQLDNNITWEFRAMVELAVGFTQHAHEFAGNPIDGNGTASGGRPQDMANRKTGWFEDVEIEKEENNGKQP
jgi:hypothetical protein